MKKAILRTGAALLLAAVIALGGGALTGGRAFAAERATPKVEIYTTSWCGYCKQAVAYLKSKKVPFVEYDVEKDEAAARRWQELSQGGGVPVAVIGKRVVRGYSRDVYEKILSEGGRQ